MLIGARMLLQNVIRSLSIYLLDAFSNPPAAKGLKFVYMKHRMQIRSLHVRPTPYIVGFNERLGS